MKSKKLGTEPNAMSIWRHFIDVGEAMERTPFVTASVRVDARRGITWPTDFALARPRRAGPTPLP